MAIEIKYIRVGELIDYVNSADYGEQAFEAISRLRAVSHANNPRASAQDVALILAYDEGKLVGYLGAIPEKLYIREREEHVCWYSCMWVLPEYRRAGIAKMLLEDAGRHYHNRVLITNYIPQSKAAFLKNDQFQEILVLKGIRAYLRFDLSRIILRRKPGLTWLKPLLWLLDDLGNLFVGLWFGLKRYSLKRYQISKVEKPGSELSAYLEKVMHTSPFRRGGAEFEWLLEYPWVKNENEDKINPKRYYFSQFAPDFKQWMLEIRNKEGKLEGAALLTKHKGELKTHYVIYTDPLVIPDLFRYIYRLMRIEKISTLVCHSEALVKEIKKNRKSFITQRPSEYGFMGTPFIAELLGDEPGNFFEGDGDSMFT